MSNDQMKAPARPRRSMYSAYNTHPAIAIQYNNVPVLLSASYDMDKFVIIKLDR